MNKMKKIKIATILVIVNYTLSLICFGLGTINNDIILYIAAIIAACATIVNFITLVLLIKRFTSQ